MVRLSRNQLLLHGLSLSRFSLNMEFGVFEGKTINHCARQYPQKEFFGFDSFRGLPEDWREGFPRGTFNRNGAPPQVESNVHLVIGDFKHSLPTFLSSRHGPASFIHMDCDLYSSTKCVLQILGERVVPGTVIIFDEFYNYQGWELGEHLAWMEFCLARAIKYQFIGFNPDHQQAGVQVL